MQVQRTLPGPEDIVPFATDHLPYELPAMASLAHDLLDTPFFDRARQLLKRDLPLANMLFAVQPPLFVLGAHCRVAN
ncbi:hypothetical protein [Bradyrhizobium genosp. P]|uniref:hypothetical protein n=1 Tax=Bradyrhizobium genosp. P TaxID=83641 RepID=UPI003CEB4177